MMHEENIYIYIYIVDICEDDCMCIYNSGTQWYKVVVHKRTDECMKGMHECSAKGKYYTPIASTMNKYGVVVGATRSIFL